MLYPSLRPTYYSSRFCIITARKFFYFRPKVSLIVPISRIYSALHSHKNLTLSTVNFLILKCKGKVRPRTGHEGLEGEQICSSTLSLTSVLDGSEWSIPRPGRFTHGKDSLYIGGWVDPRAGLDWCGKSRLHQDSIPGPSTP